MELALTVWLSRHFTAAELAQARYDLAYFGRGAYGFEDAAARYFCKWPEELELHELALLVGNLQAPDRSARSHDYALNRRDFMLRHFAKRGLISEADAAAAAARSVEVSEFCLFVPDRPRMCVPGVPGPQERLVNSGS